VTNDIGLAWKGAGFDEALGGFLHDHDVFGRLLDDCQRRIVPVGRERRIPVDGIATVQCSPDTLDHATGIVRRRMGDRNRCDGSRRSDDAD
jgi:hypothetical protein